MDICTTSHETGRLVEIGGEPVQVALLRDDYRRLLSQFEDLVSRLSTCCLTAVDYEAARLTIQRARAREKNHELV